MQHDMKSSVKQPITKWQRRLRQ